MPKPTFFPYRSGLGFGEAVRHCVTQGVAIARWEWNGKGMFLVYNPGFKALPVDMVRSEALHDYFAKLGKEHVDFLPSISLKTAEDTVQVGWSPTPADILADDWMILVLNP